jgi:hypothetical protein
LPSRSSRPRTRTHARQWLIGETRWPSSDAAAWVKRFILRACDAPTTVAVILIGSLARATHEPGDVDLLYIHDGEPQPFGDHPVDVDIRAYTKDELSSRLERRHGLVTWALRFGRVICQRDSFWSELVASFGGELPLPSVHAVQDQARRAADVHDELIEIGDDDAAFEQRLLWLTHEAWACLLAHQIHPASRPELPEQLRSVGESSLAGELAAALRQRVAAKRSAAAKERIRERRAG